MDIILARRLLEEFRNYSPLPLTDKKMFLDLLVSMDTSVPPRSFYSSIPKNCQVTRDMGVLHFLSMKELIWNRQVGKYASPPSSNHRDRIHLSLEREEDLVRMMDSYTDHPFSVLGEVRSFYKGCRSILMKTSPVLAIPSDLPEDVKVRTLGRWGEKNCVYTGDKPLRMVV